MDVDFRLRNGRVGLPALLTLPAGPVRAAVVALHPANDPSRHQRLFGHLSDTLVPEGIAVLRYDRRPPLPSGDVPFEDQASDALCALRFLRARPETRGAPVGLWGWSQGAWVAGMVASRSDDPRFLILLASTGVSPAEQMRYGTAEHLRRARFGRNAVREMLALRRAYEAAVRDPARRPTVERLVARYRRRRWFPLAYVPADLPDPLVWPNMDFDPREDLGRIRVPVLLFYGEHDEWTPIVPSIRAWRRSQRTSWGRSLEIVRLPATGHAPILERGPGRGSVSPLYSETLRSWGRAVSSVVTPPHVAPGARRPPRRGGKRRNPSLARG
jgi:uncharacterized protein